MEETQRPTTSKYALQYGLLLGGISVVLGIILYSMDLHYQGGLSILGVSLVIMLGCIIVGLLQFKKANNGYMSFGQGMKIGIGICLIGGIISMAYQLLLSHVIDPEMMSKQLEIIFSPLSLQYIESNLQLLGTHFLLAFHLHTTVLVKFFTKFNAYQDHVESRIYSGYF